MTKSDRHLAQFISRGSAIRSTIRAWRNLLRTSIGSIGLLAEQIPGFVWQTLHRRFYARREEWFEPINTTLVFWWVPVGHHPDMSEGVARLDHLLVHDPSDYAFGWKEIADAKLWKTARGDALSEHAA
jgi:Domain of unknown function (DUF3291)